MPLWASMARVDFVTHTAGAWIDLGRLGGLISGISRNRTYVHPSLARVTKMVPLQALPPTPSTEICTSNPTAPPGNSGWTIQTCCWRHRTTPVGYARLVSRTYTKVFGCRLLFSPRGKGGGARAPAHLPARPPLPACPHGWFPPLRGGGRLGPAYVNPRIRKEIYSIQP